MRHKIAKRIRRKILKSAVITEERWINKGNKKESCFYVEGNCNGWRFCSADDDELSAYRVALRCVQTALEKSFEQVKEEYDGKNRNI